MKFDTLLELDFSGYQIPLDLQPLFMVKKISPAKVYYMAFLKIVLEHAQCENIVHEFQ